MPDLRLAMFPELLETQTKYGRYTITPLVEGVSCEFQIDFQIKSSKFGYYALASDGKLLTAPVPVNQPIMTNAFIFGNGADVSVAFYDLRTIIDEPFVDEVVFVGHSFESTLNQKCFKVTEDTPITLVLTLQRVGEIEGVEYGTLV